MIVSEITRTFSPAAKVGRVAAARWAGVCVARMLLLLLALLALGGPAVSTARAQPVAWTQRVVSSPSARSVHGMAYDAARSVTVLFGGATDTGISAETWEWNGTAWTPRVVSGPSARGYPAMAYDAARGVTVLFGGWTGFYNAETWEWNGTVWTQRVGGSPSARYLHATAYDAARGVTVLFGGATDGGISAETWEWNGTVWTQRVISGPSARYSHAMAYDAARGVTVLFGGWTGTYNAETWEWNGTVWTQRSITGPSARGGHAMAYDAARGVTVLFGGTSASSAEMWEWNGTVWTQRVVNGPSVRANHAMAYDTARDVTVLFGGGWTGTTSAETWELAVPCVAPSITTQPVDQVVGVDASVAFFVEAASGPGCLVPQPLTYQWQRRNPVVFDPNAAGAWINLTDGGGFVHTQTSALLITRPILGLATGYRCIITGCCAIGQPTVTYTDTVNFSVACPADFNADGGIDGADVEAFFERWVAGC
jgi:hypothetical protein